jgi:hypothetical protein
MDGTARAVSVARLPWATMDSAEQDSGKNGARVEVDFDASNFVLYRLPSGALELNAVANHSATYFFVTHLLSQEDADKYRSRGKAYLLSLANRVRADYGGSGQQTGRHLAT